MLLGTGELRARDVEQYLSLYNNFEPSFIVIGFKYAPLSK
jgi:hypothetical protein